MFRWVLQEFITDAMVVVPTGVFLSLLLVGIVVKFNIHPIVDWLYEED